MQKSFFSIVLVMASLGCKQAGQTALEGAKACGDQECPVGTAFAEFRSVREGFELDVGFDPKTYSGEVAFKNFGEGECTYTCETINACPVDTFPVIREDCFTCGVVNANGEVVQGACDTSRRAAADTGF